MHSSAPSGILPEPPAAHGPLLGDDETARLAPPVSVLAPLAASKGSIGALSPTDVALFPTCPCANYQQRKEANRRITHQAPFSPEGAPATHSAASPGLPTRFAALYNSARGGLLSFFNIYIQSRGGGVIAGQRTCNFYFWFSLNSKPRPLATSPARLLVTS